MDSLIYPQYFMLKLYWSSFQEVKLFIDACSLSEPIFIHVIVQSNASFMVTVCFLQFLVKKNKLNFILKCFLCSMLHRAFNTFKNHSSTFQPLKCWFSFSQKYKKTSIRMSMCNMSVQPPSEDNSMSNLRVTLIYLKEDCTL